MMRGGRKCRAMFGVPRFWGPRRSGEIGRRASLRGWSSKGGGGSSPPFDTIISAGHSVAGDPKGAAVQANCKQKRSLTRTEPPLGPFPLGTCRSTDLDGLGTCRGGGVQSDRCPRCRMQRIERRQCDGARRSGVEHLRERWTTLCCRTIHNLFLGAALGQTVSPIKTGLDATDPHYRRYGELLRWS